MEIPGHPGVTVTTDDGAEFGSNVANIVQGQILPNVKTGVITYDKNTMWQSSKSNTGWVQLQITFPFAVELSRIVVHSQHSGEYHAAKAVRISVVGSSSRVQPIKEVALTSVDATVYFPKMKSNQWNIEFQAGESSKSCFADCSSIPAMTSCSSLDSVSELNR